MILERKPQGIYRTVSQPTAELSPTCQRTQTGKLPASLDASGPHDLEVALQDGTYTASWDGIAVLEVTDLEEGCIGNSYGAFVAETSEASFAATLIS